MSTVKTNNVQIGQSVTATNNFTWYQPASPDGTVRLGNGNSGSVTDLITVGSTGNLTFTGTTETYTNSVTITAASTKTLTLNGGAGSNGLVIDASNNVGLGVTPSAWNTSNSVRALQLNACSLWSYSTTYLFLGQNYYYNTSGNRVYSTTAPATEYQQYNGSHIWYTAASGTAGNSFTFTQAMTLDASGRLGVEGQTSPRAPLSFAATAGTAGDANKIRLYDDGASNIYGLGISTGQLNIRAGTSGAVAFFINNTSQAMSLDASGNLLVGTTSAAQRLTVKGTTVGALSLVFNASSAVMVEVNGSNTINGVDGTPNANGLMRVWRDSGNTRSISAAGTINASGADYAEYMTKAGDFEIAKGDICGIDSSGLLTNVFADAISFVVKSTDPSYVGGDSWGADIEDKDVLEIERQKVDRIAFAGQVPVNVLGAKAGDYIIPVADKKGIKGAAVSNPTFEQYQIAVGKVIAVEADGRAKIIVKVT